MRLYGRFLQATQAVKIQFKLGKNPVYQTGNFKLENVKNQVQINKGLGFASQKTTLVHLKAENGSFIEQIYQ